MGVFFSVAQEGQLNNSIFPKRTAIEFICLLFTFILCSSLIG
jgi:hypothetical protein